MHNHRRESLFLLHGAQGGFEDVSISAHAGCSLCEALGGGLRGLPVDWT